MRRPAWLAVATALTLTACAASLRAPAAGGPPFPECEADAYAFVGETSLAAIGLADMWPEEAGRVGEIWVTAVPVPQFGPPGAAPMGQRVVCLEFDDGSGMAGPIDDAWQPPGAGLALPDAGGDLPWAGLTAIAAVILVLVISLFAFRTKPKEPGEST
jgi:hypothetical protein